MSACEYGGGGAGDDAGEALAELCNSDCQEPLVCFYAVTPNPGPDDWKQVGEFCADGLFTSDDPGLVDAEKRMKCRSISGILDDTYRFEYEGAECPLSLAEDCEDWVPREHVSQSPKTMVYEIERALLESLLDDPAPLTGCDSARIIEQTSAKGFELADVAATDFAFALGLKSGDRIVSLNGHLIQTYDDLFGALIYFRDRDEHSYSLVIERQGAVLMLRYEVTP